MVKKSLVKSILISIITSLVLVFTLGAGVGFLLHKDNTIIPAKKQLNDLTVNQNFSINQYVIINGKAYAYSPIDTQEEQDNQTTPAFLTASTSLYTLTFDENNTLELIFLKENITPLASTYTIGQENIASKFQAIKNVDGSISIQIIDLTDVVNITTSDDADYTLYSLAFSTEATLNFANGEFSVGEKKGSTSLTDATAKTTTQILNLANGSFKFSGEKTYSPKTTTTEVDGSPVTTITPGRAFYQTGGTLTLEDITLDGFYIDKTIESNYGGAVLNQGGTLNIGCNIQNSSAYAGGAIGNMGVMTVTGGTYSHNTAQTAGGALANIGIATIEDGEFSQNSAYFAGAIYNTMGQLSINDVTIYGNNASWYGGAIFNDSEMGYSYLTINDGDIYNNTAKDGGAIANECAVLITGGNIYENTASDYGGAVCLSYEADNATLTITGGTFSKNTAPEGGAVYVSSYVENITVNISDATFTGNQAIMSGTTTSVFNGGGGAIAIESPYVQVTISNSTFDENTATMFAGAMGLLCDATISDCTFTGNVVLSEEDYAGAAVLGVMNDVVVTFNNCSISGNAAYLGSVVTAMESAEVYFIGCDINQNTAFEGTFCAVSADIYVMNSSVTDNYAYVASVAIAGDDSIFGVDNSVVTNNHAEYGATIGGISSYIGIGSNVDFSGNTYGEEVMLPGDIYLEKNCFIVIAGELTSNYELGLSDFTVGTVVAVCLENSMASTLMPVALEHLFLVDTDKDVTLALNSSNQIVIQSSGLAPGVYNYLTDELLATWEECKATGLFTVSNGTLQLATTDFSSAGVPLKVVIGEDVTTIPDQFMAQAKGIASLIFPSSITSIGMFAFAYCADLEEVVFKDSYVNIGIFAFMLCTNLKYLDVGDNVTGYGAFSFAGTSLYNTSLHIKASTSFEAYAFQCSMIKEITVDSAHPTMTTLDGVVYSKDYSVLALCPTGVSGELTIPNSVGMVLAGAFFGCYNLSGTLTMPSGLTEICDTQTVISDGSGTGISAVMLLGVFGFGLFSYAGMSSIVLPANIIDLPYYTFSGCPNLANITWPTNLQTIGEGCFRDCTGLIDIVVPDTVTSIGQNCFNGCTSLQTADLGDGITIIPANLFYQAVSLEWVNIGASVTKIENQAFYNCTKLRTVVWNDKLTSIGLSAFYNCASLEGTFTAPSALTTISSHAFQNCSSLTGVVFNSNLTTLGDHAFQSCTGLVGTLTIPNSVTTISRQAFQDCTGLTGLSIGNSVTTIGDLAFYNCNNIRGNLSLPNTLVSIGQSAFRNMPGLTGSLYLASTMETLGAYAFRDCTGLTSLTIYGNNLVINEQAFYNCTGLTSLTLGSGVLSIGDSAFYGCNNITSSLTIPSTTTTISNSAFQNCTKLTGLTLGSNIQTIGETAFYGCSGMSGSVTFPTALKTIGKSAFRSLKLTGSINLPNIVTIGESAFQDCTGFTSLVLGNSATTVENLAFYGCTGLTSMNLGTGIQTIGQSAFRNCSNVVGEINLPNIKTIGNYAFHTASKITSVKIGGTIQQVGDGVFANCTSILTHYYIDCTSIPTLTNANCFNNINPDCKIWVPGALYNNWIVATNWATWEPYIYAYEDVAGLFDANGNQLYTWSQLVNNGMITLNANGNTITASNITIAGNLIISSSITEIGTSAFRDNSTLTGVTFPETLTKIDTFAFNRCTGLTGTLTIPDSVISVGGEAFSQCFGISGLDLGNGLQTIGPSAFSELGLADGYTITFPASIVSIGNYAFYYPNGVYKYIFDCRNLSKDTIIPSSSSSLVGHTGTSYKTEFIYPYEKAFEFITSKWITFPINAETYKWMDASGNVYTDVGGLYDNVTNERIYTWDYLVSYGYVTVSGTTIINSTDLNGRLSGKLIISSGITAIDNGAFWAKTGITHVVFQENVTSIGAGAFEDCTGLNAVTFLHKKSSKTLDFGISTFYNCTSLTGVYVENADFFESVAVFADAYSNPLYYANYMYHIGGVECTGINYARVISGTNYLIGNYAYYNCLSLTSVDISGNFDIGEYAYSGCSNILTFDFTGYNGKTYLPACGVGAFDGINAKAQIIVPAAKYYDWIAAPNWSTYKDYIVPDGELPDISGGLYDSSGNQVYSWSELVSNGYITLDGTTITSANSSYIQGKLVIPSSITEIGEEAFGMCLGLTAVEFSEGLKIIHSRAFYWTGLSGDIILPNSLTTIGDIAFGLNPGITSLTIGSNVSSIGNQILDPNIVGTNSSVTTITVSSSNPYYSSTGPALFNKNKTTLLYFAPGWSGNYTVPNSVTTIGTRAFSNHRKLTGITMSSVTTIESEAFYNCTALQFVSFGKSISTLGKNALFFDVGDNFENIDVNGPNIQYYDFTSATKVVSCSTGFFTNALSCSIYVPSDLLSSWKTATYWSDHASRIVTGTPTLYTSSNINDGAVASLLISVDNFKTQNNNETQAVLIDRFGLKDDDVDDIDDNSNSGSGDGNNGVNTPNAPNKTLTT